MMTRQSLINIPQAVVLALLLMMEGIFPAAMAGEVSGLYEAEVPVKSQGDAERNQALNTALVEVLIKVSGNRNVTSIASLQPVLSHPMGLVQQFRYRELPKFEDRETVQSEGNRVENPFTQVLRVSFDAQAINQALNDAGLPVWGRARPSTLLWLAVEDGNERYLLGVDDHPDIQELIRQEAHRRGVPVMIPLMDLEDQANLRFTDVWGNFQDVIVDASSRYQPEAVLVGRLYRQFDGLWQARWSLYLKDDRQQQWEISGDESRDIITAGIDGSADILSSKFSKIISEVDSGDIMIMITDVNSLEDYARTMKYLRSLDAVTQLQIEEVSASTVMLMVGIRSDRTELEQAIGFGSTLAPVSSLNDTTDNDLMTPQTLAAAQTLHYRLLR